MTSRRSQNRNRRPTVFALWAGFLAALFSDFHAIDHTPQVSQAETVVVGLLKDLGVKPNRDLEREATELVRTGRIRLQFLEQRYRVPAGFSWKTFQGVLRDRLKSSRRMTILKTDREARQGVWMNRLEIGFPGMSLYRLVLIQPRATAAPIPSEVSTAPPAPMAFPKGKGKIAIVLDDWGYSLRQVPFLKTIRAPLTVAVLPGLPHSAEVARIANESGHEVILHMPMEAQDPNAPREAGTLLTSMSKEQVIDQLRRSLETVPFVKGISNHQGSKATIHRPLMEVILGEVRRRRLYFLDSLVTDDSLCGEVAKGLRIPFARRSVFLDNEKSPAAIRERFIELAKVAAKEGQAIGIGHDRPGTLQVLEETIPALVQAGYQLVPASELAKETR